MAVELNTAKDFHKVGYTYAFFWWGLFTFYCLAYQLDRLLVYRARRLRSQGKITKENDNVPFSILGFVGGPFKRIGDHVIQIPFITTWMPIKHIIGVSLFCIINALWILFAPFKLAPDKTWGDTMIIKLMDRRGAYVGMVNWSFVFVLGSRNTVVTRMSGMTFEGLIPFHRWLARIGFCEFVPHFVWRIMKGYQKHYVVKDALFEDIEQGTGTIAMIGFLLLFVTSFEWIRRNFFEVFYYCHIVGIIIAIIAACWHEVACFYYFIPAVLLWVFDRIWRTYQSWWPNHHQTKLLSVQAFHHESSTTQSQQQGITHVLFEYGRLKHYHPGQYVFVTLVNKTKKAFWNYANWHPMTISEILQPALVDGSTTVPTKGLNEKILTSKNKKTLQDGKKEKIQQENHQVEQEQATTSSSSSSSSDSSLTNMKNRRNRNGDIPAASLHIKALGSYTQDLLDAGMQHKELDFRVDGPYGPRLEYQDYKTMACFAAGIGITPALTLIKDCVERRAAGVDTVTTDQIHLVWAIRTLDELTPFTDLIIYWTEQCQKAVNPFQLYLDIYVTRQQEINDNTTELQDKSAPRKSRHWIQDLDHCQVTFNTRPDISKCMDRIESMVSLSDNNKKKSSVWVHTCGSDDFMRLIMNQAIQHDWDVHHETFEF
ncbi:ferric reductase like transmembrane component-domain-containing protein [Phascolomyces articulosus]|uniref:Ferric reductase like transmembrane component-domain-containing protein n=1 Tax=Phascolomyces articulosus TaxID=60185 RepID=A0AAD5JYZ3_9FUNG|nr:ferric reductase like transmembrane component-domain-containing protein [Phascolomyces articulosus]